jgi:hypothetical protein
MSIRLKWKNPNTGASVVRIYRSLTPIDTAALPDPILEVADGSTQYLDEFPKYGESFYYVFSVTISGRTIFSPNKLYSCVIDLGPGPQDLVLGDFKMGYFGTTSTFELGFSSSIYPSGVFSKLYKIARNGKILYLPLTHISTNTNALVAAKVLTSGVNARNDPYAGAAGMIREFNGRLYAMRCAKLWDEENLDTDILNYQPTYGTSYAGVPAAMGKSELIDIVRMAKKADISIPTRFTFNTSNLNADVNTPLASCDFTSATSQTTAYYTTDSNHLTDLKLGSKTFSSSSMYYPVIEYKGLA